MNLRVAAAVAAACCALAAGARAHVVYGTETLRGLVVESDVVARVRIVDPGKSTPGVAQGEPIVVAELLEALKSLASLSVGPVRFVQHGHGVPLYTKGQEAVVFLQKLARNRELAALAGEVDWVSIQEGDPLPGTPAQIAALRAYVALEQLPLAEQPTGLRKLTVKLLASPDRKLASSAVRDVALLQNAPIVTAEDLPALGDVLWSDATAIGVRIALLSELERRKLVEGPLAWVKLLRTTRGADRIAVARALGAHPGAAVTHELISLLASPDTQLVSTAAISLGVPGNEPAVAPLTKLLASADPRVRNAAIRSLGRIGSPAAQASLSKAAAEHPDADTRRRAGAAVPRQP